MTCHSIGIDISKDTLTVHALPNGIDISFANTSKGCDDLLAWLRMRAIDQPVDKIVYEPTRVYHKAIETCLNQTGLPLLKVNGLQSRRVAEAIGSRFKSDPVDARMLAQMGRLDMLRSAAIPTQKLPELKELHVARQNRVKAQTSALNRQKILETQLLRQQVAQELKLIKRHIENIDETIRAIFDADPNLRRRRDILQTIPGIASQTAHALLIEMPEIGTVDAKQAAGLAGLAPITRQSGTWHGHRFIGGGRALLRKILYMPAVAALKCNTSLKTKHLQLKAAGKPFKVAITAIMRKLLILANTLLKQDRTWSPKHT